MSREAIYAALFAKVSAAAAFKTTSRRLRHFSDVAQADQPALFQRQISEEPMQSRGLPSKLTMRAELYIYVNTGGDSTIAPATVINPINDAIVAALAPDPGPTNAQTLGGLVSHCWISGAIETYEGDVLGDQAIVIFPIEILVTE